MSGLRGNLQGHGLKKVFYDESQIFFAYFSYILFAIFEDIFGRKRRNEGWGVFKFRI